MRLVLCVGHDRLPKRLAEFRKRSYHVERLWLDHDDTRRFEVDTGRDILRVIRHTHSQVSAVAILCHGWPDRILARQGGISLSDIPDLADALGGVATPDLYIGLCCCNAGADCGHSSWSWRSYGPGGAQSFAAHLYRAMLPFAASCRVHAHAAKGNTTGNLAKRGWSDGVDVGASLLDRYLPPGPDAREGWFRLSPRRREWKAVLEREDDHGVSGATYLAAGLVPPWMP